MAATSVVENAPLVKKVMLPRLVFPFAAVGGTLTIFSASLLVIVVVAAVNGKLGARTRSRCFRWRWRRCC